MRSKCPRIETGEIVDEGPESPKQAWTPGHTLAFLPLRQGQLVVPHRADVRLDTLVVCVPELLPDEPDVPALSTKLLGPGQDEGVLA